MNDIFAVRLTKIHRTKDRIIFFVSINLDLRIIYLFKLIHIKIHRNRFNPKVATVLLKRAAISKMFANSNWWVVARRAAAWHRVDTHCVYNIQSKLNKKNISQKENNFFLSMNFGFQYLRGWPLRGLKGADLYNMYNSIWDSHV